MKICHAGDPRIGYYQDGDDLRFDIEVETGTQKSADRDRDGRHATDRFDVYLHQVEEGEKGLSSKRFIAWIENVRGRNVAKAAEKLRRYGDRLAHRIDRDEETAVRFTRDLNE